MADQFEFVIVRSDDRLSSAELKSRLEASPGWDSSLQIRIVKSTLDTRPVDPTFLAILTTGGAALGALFGALGGVAQSLGKHKIAIRWADGTSVEVEGRNAEEILKKVIPLPEAKPGGKIVVSV
jgi:hypothetical protein